MNQSFAYSISGAGQIVTDSECNDTQSFWEITPLNGQANASPSSGQGTAFNATFPAPGEYEINVLDLHPNCPNGNDQMTVCVYPELLAQGTAAPTNGCAPLAVNLEDLSQNPAICGDPTTEWVISGPGHTWISGGPSDVAPIVELTNAGTYTITLRVAIPDKDACPPDELEFTIEVFEPPTVEVGSLTMICAGDELDMIIESLDDGGTPLSNWSWQLDGDEFSDVQGTVPLSFSDPGEYVVTGEATNLCGQDTSNIYIDVDSIPEIDFELPDLPAYCEGDTLLVIATGAETYTWNSSPVIVGDLHSHCVPIVPQSNVSLGLSANSANGCTNTATIDIDIAPLPEVSIVPPPAPCPGETVTFTGTATGGSGTYAPFQWSGSAGSGAGTDFTWTAPGSAGAVNVELTVIDDVGCDNSATANLTSFDNPTVEAGDTLILCNNDAVTEPLTGYSPGLSESGGSGVWSGAGLSGVDSFTPAGVGLYDLTYTYTDANGCTESDTRTVVVEELTQVDPGLPVEACFGDPDVTMDDFAPATATWSGTGVTADGTLDPSVAPGTYTLTIENGVLSCFTSDTKTFTVHPLPEPVITGTEVLCEGDTAQLLLSEPEGATVEWTFDATAPAALDTVAGTVDMAFTGLATSAFGCEATVNRTVLVNPLPVVVAPLQDAFCNQSIPATLTGATPSGGTWSGPGVTDPTGAFLPSDAGTGESLLLYTYTDPATGCTNRDSVEVSVVEPQEAEAGPDLSVCDIDTALTLTDFTPVNGGSWTGAGVTDPTGLLDAGPLGPGSYTLTYTFGSGTCESIDDRTLVVLPRPVIDLTADVAALCDGDSVFFSAAVSAGQPPYTYEWAAGVVPGANGANTTAATGYAAAGTPLIATLTVTDANGCSETASLEVTVWPLPTVDAGVDVQFCNQPIPVQLDGFSPAGGDWSGPGITSPDGTFLPSDVGAGTYEAVYSFTDANGCLNRDTAVVEVIEPQIAEAGPDLSLCDIDTTFVLEGFSPVTASGWTGDGVAPDGTVTADPLTPGTYTLTYSIGTGTCLSTDTRELEIRPLPAIALSVDDPTVCDGTPATWSAAFSGATGPYAWTWSASVGGADGTGVTASAGTDVDLSAGPTEAASIVVVDATGCTDSLSLSVDILALPDVSGGGDTVFCNTGIAGQLEGFSPGLTDNGTGSWAGIGGAFPAVGADGSFAPDLSGTGQFQAVYTYTEAATGCLQRDTILVDVTDPVTADAGPDTTVCDNAPLLQLGGYFPATNVTWSSTGDGGTALLDAATGLIQPTLLGPGDYTYLLEYGYGTCYTLDERVVHVDPLPVVTTSGTDLFCENDGTVVLASGAPAGGTWEGNGITNGTGDFATGLPLTGPGTFPLEYWYEDPLTGCRDTAQHSVTVQPIPTVDAGLDTTFCNQPIPGDLLGFAPGLAEDGTGSWSGLGALAGAVAADGTVDPSAAGAGTFGAVYTYTAAATGCTHTDTLEVVIAEPLVADAGPDTTVCDNAFPLQLVGFPATDASWSGTTPAAQTGLIDDATGLVQPGPMAPGTYAYLIEYGIGTCYTQDEVTVTIDPLPVLDIASPDAFCANLGIVALAEATPAGGIWFGPGIADPTGGTFTSGIAPGDYAPAYTYQDPATGCRDTLVHAVTVHPVPVAAFSADTLGCSNLDLPITNSSTGQTTHDWDFGGVGSSAAETPGFTFPGDGTYTITLIAGNAFGCQDTTAQDVDITHPPTADFLLTPDSGCAPLDVEFANLSDAPYGTYLWTVNGDDFAQEAPPQLNFAQGDSVVDYSVSLLASNLCGNDAMTDAIVVYPSPVMVFAFEEDTVCSPFDMDLINASTGLPDDVQWDFGDGTGFTGFDPPNHWYEVDTVEQVFTVTLIGSNQCGADTTSGDVLVLPNQVEAFFTLSTPDGCAPFDVTVEDFSSATTAVSYTFDNGDFAATPTASTTYPDPGTYTITQFVTNGCSFDTLQIPVTVHPVPEVALSVSDPNGCEGAEFAFTSVTDNPGNADWDFGDGNVGGGLTATHAYDASGTFTVTFSTEAPLTGCTAEESLVVDVYPNPVASIGLDDGLGCAPLTVTFTNTSSGSQFQTWDFGDGSEPGFQSVPSHVFANTGLEPVLYDVTLVAESPQLCADSTTVTITVLPTPVAGFTLAEEESCTFPVDIVTTNTSTGSINHSWAINGETQTTAPAPVFSADAVGTYDVTLTASNSYGCSDVAEAPFTVHLAPIANLSANPRIGCNPLSVDFQDLSSYSQATSLFIDGIYDGPLPTDGLVIDQVGTFESYIVATSPEGCTDTLTLAEDFTVHPVPTADFSYIPLTVSPENTSFQFNNESNTAFATNWTFGDGNGSFIPDPLHRYDEPGEYQVVLSVQNEFGCTDLAVDLLVIDDKISVFVPNAFTPASDGIGDGINDGFKPVIRGINLIQKYRFQVFDRWGTVIFETYDYDEFWKGDVYRGREDTFDYFAQNEIYNWKVTLTLPGEEADEVELGSNPFCNGPRQFCGHVSLIR
ncbi:MAG: PKD domain-containing protein [Flavobacteriales bacterium]